MDEVHDFAWVFVDGAMVGVMDRRSQQFQVNLPVRSERARLDILVEAMGRVNFGAGVHDRKGLHSPVQLLAAASAAAESVVLENWGVYSLDLSPPRVAGLQWVTGSAKAPAFWRGHFDLDQSAVVADTFLDLSSWGKGVLWVNSHCLGRFWNIGPTQSMYLPAPWMKEGRNEVVVLDLIGPEAPVIAGLTEPILGRLRPGLDFGSANTAPKMRFVPAGATPVHAGAFADGPQAQDVRFAQGAAAGRQFCIEILSAHGDEPFAAIAELDLFDAENKFIPHNLWTIAAVSSEERLREDGSALNAIDGQTSNYWHSEWSARQAKPPHYLVIDLGASVPVGGLRYTPRAGSDSVNGRIRDYRIYVGDRLAELTNAANVSVTP